MAGSGLQSEPGYGVANPGSLIVFVSCLLLFNFNMAYAPFQIHSFSLYSRGGCFWGHVLLSKRMLFPANVQRDIWLKLFNPANIIAVPGAITSRHGRTSASWKSGGCTWLWCCSLAGSDRGLFGVGVCIVCSLARFALLARLRWCCCSCACCAACPCWVLSSVC